MVNLLDYKNEVLSGEIIMTVKELIKRLEQFSEDMEVVDAGYMDIESVYESTWIHTNYPYDKPNKQVVIIN